MKTGCASFAIIGGDKRQLFCAASLSEDGYAVTLGGFDSIKEMKNVEITSPFEAALLSDVIILPLPCVNGKGEIPDPFSKSDIPLTADLMTAMKGKKIFCGMQERFKEVCPNLSGNIFDYYKREDFTVYNAYVTAEGALDVAMRTFEGTILGSRCLVCGFGRIGKILTSMLRSLGADVYASARKPEDLAWIELAGAKAVRTDELHKLENFDIIFNTVPAQIFTSVLLAKIATRAVLIDLASGEGGVDKYAAERLGITYIHALSLPGKAAPKTAGEIIKNTIYHILEEDDR